MTEDRRFAPLLLRLFPPALLLALAVGVLVVEGGVMFLFEAFGAHRPSSKVVLTPETGIVLLAVTTSAVALLALMLLAVRSRVDASRFREWERYREQNDRLS